MIELLDHIPRSVATNGRYAREVFTREGRLRHIHRLNYWPLDRVLEEKYKFPREEVRGARHRLAAAAARHRGSSAWVAGQLLALFCCCCCQPPLHFCPGFKPELP
jgi:hypothetical protein